VIALAFVAGLFIGAALGIVIGGLMAAAGKETK
jgi:hypothetical protein